MEEKIWERMIEDRKEKIEDLRVKNWGFEKRKAEELREKGLSSEENFFSFGVNSFSPECTYL